MNSLCVLFLFVTPLNWEDFAVIEDAVGAASPENAYCGLKSISFGVTQISLFWHKHPATKRKGKEVLIVYNKLFIIVEKNNQMLPFIVK